MAQLPDTFPQQHVTALSIRTGPVEKEVIQVEELLRAAQVLKEQDRGDYQTQLEDIAKSGQDELDKLRAELEHKFLEVSKDGRRQVQRKLRDKSQLLERLRAAETFVEQNKEQMKKVSELQRKQEDVRNAGWTALRELTHKTQELEKLEKKVLMVEGHILHKTESELAEAAQRPGQPNARALQDLADFMKRYEKGRGCSCQAGGRWDKTEEALRRKEDEVAALYRTFHAQKKETEEALAALEGKLQQQLEEQEQRHQRRCSEGEDAFEKKVQDTGEGFRKELSQAQERFSKKLREKHKNLRKELSKSHQQRRKELLEKEEGAEKKVFEMATKEVKRRDETLGRELTERQEQFRKELLQREKSLKSQVLERVQKELSEREDGFRKELSAMEESFKKEASERKQRFLMEASELEENFKKKLSERQRSFAKELSRREETSEETWDRRDEEGEQRAKQPWLQRSIQDRQQRPGAPQRSAAQKVPSSSAADPQAKARRRFLTSADLEPDHRS